MAAAEAPTGRAMPSHARAQSIEGTDQVSTMARIAEQVDAAQAALLREADTSRAVSELARSLGCSRKRAQRLVLAAKLRLRREARHATREQTKDLLRAQFNHAISLAVSRKRSMLVGVGVGLQRIAEVDDPDLRSLIEAAKALTVLDDLAGPIAEPVTSNGNAHDSIERALQKHYFGEVAQLLSPSTAPSRGR